VHTAISMDKILTILTQCVGTIGDKDFVHMDFQIFGKGNSLFSLKLHVFFMNVLMETCFLGN
jgi:hypothetical protein